MALLTRDAILGASDIQTEDVHVPEWGGTVRVKGLTAAQRDAFEMESVQGRGKQASVNFANIRARLAAKCIVGEDGKPIFTEFDIKALGEKSSSALNRVFDVCSRLSGIGESDVEELSKNSEADQSEGSPSA
ncbi:MAG TPA: hypothetical protein VNZ58_03650 [Thermomicrobiales bacterium]|nr:hypothetical protein [Thermomicrobiales bacterium]